MRRTKKYNNYRNLCSYLKRTLSVDYPISIRRTTTGCQTGGDCDFDGKRFIIRISNQYSEDAAIAALVHEIGHVLSWFKEDEEHGKFFGLAYVKAYNHFLKWVYSD